MEVLVLGLNFLQDTGAAQLHSHHDVILLFSKIALMRFLGFLLTFRRHPVLQNMQVYCRQASVRWLLVINKVTFYISTNGSALI